MGQLEKKSTERGRLRTANFSRDRAQIGRVCRNVVKSSKDLLGQILTEIEPNLVDPGPQWIESEQTLPKSGRSRPNSPKLVDSVQRLPEVEPNLVDFARMWSKSGHVWAPLGHIGQAGNFVPPEGGQN